MTLRWRWVLKSTLIVLFVLAMILTVIEITVRLLFPEQMPRAIHQVLYFEPDSWVGWKMAENFQFTWQGHFTDCIEFDTTITTNAWGFRGDNWVQQKPDDSLRVAVIGDSFAEAFQVSSPETAAAVLETSLRDMYPNRTVEVMNFGVSNYSVGQFQLVYEHHAQQFQPDYVFVLVAYFHMWRNASPTIPAVISDYESLRMRPTYSLDASGQLRLLKPQDYDQYVEIVQALIDNDFGEDRTRVREPRFTLQFMRYLQLASYPTHPALQQRDADTDFLHLNTNYAILQRLSEQVSQNGGQLIFVDGFDYFEKFGREQGTGILQAQNQVFAEENGMGYINLSEQLRSASNRVTFPCDLHFNALGNSIFGEAMFDWVQVNVQ